MSERLFSAEWHRVGGQAFALRTHAQVARLANRGEVEYVVQNSLDGQHFRLSEAAYEVIGRLDGRQTLDEVWREALDRLGEWVPTQHELIGLISQLYRAGLIRTAGAPNLEQQRQGEVKQVRRQWLAKLKSPLGIKIPLVDPNQFLNKTQWVGRFLYGPVGFAVFAILIFVGATLALMNGQAIGQSVSDQLLGVQNLLWLAILYPLVKGIHELGHAYAVKRWGGEVHEIGVMLLVFFPVPYVDASASALFPNKGHRMMVGAAGILMELGLAALATLVWVAAEPGLVQALAYYVMILCGISTLVFNGNPLLKFDAYYVLSDWWEEPNLASKSNQQLAYLIKRHVLRLDQAAGLARTLWQNIRLVAYSAASYSYRTLITFVIAIYVATEFYVVGIVLAAMSVFFGVIKPLGTLLVAPVKDPDLKSAPGRTTWAYLLATGALVVAFLLWPAPRSLTVDALAVPASSVEVRAPLSGLIRTLPQEGDKIELGRVLVEIDPTEVVERLEQVDVQVEKAAMDLALAQGDTQAQRESQRILGLIMERQQTLQRQVDQRFVRAAHSGRYLSPMPIVRVGEFVQRGQSLGQVVDPDQLQVEAWVPESAAPQLFEVQSARALSLPRSIEMEVDIIGQSPQSTRVIDQPLMTIDGGGAIAVQSDGSGQPVAAEAYLKVRLHAHTQLLPYERLSIRFQLPHEPMAYRAYRALRRNFLSWFGR